MVGTAISFSTSDFPPLALGFMGLATGYLIYGIQELFSYPKRNAGVDFATGIWGIWLPGFFQFVAGIILFIGLMIGAFKAPPLYMAALAFTSYGIHWFAMGWTRMHEKGDIRVNLGMAIGFLLISILGTMVFLGAGDLPVAIIFIGLILVYIADILVSLKPDFPKLGASAGKALGLFHLLTGLWLLYMMFAVVLDFTLKYHWLV